MFKTFDGLNRHIFATLKILRWTMTKPQTIKLNNKTRMKKSVLMMALAIGTSAAFTQDLTSKKGEKYLPETDDWAISVDANPFLNYVGNFFGKTTPNSAPSFSYLTNNQTIVGKMFTDEKNAYRAIVRIGYTNTGTKGTVAQFSTTAPTFPTVPATVDDKQSISAFNLAVGVGLEKRRGSTRLQGYYGADVMIGLTSGGSSYTYGNALAATGGATVANSYNFGTNITTDAYGNSARVLDKSNGFGFAFGVRGFIGAEYFILPKISLGGEFGWGLGFTFSGQGSTKTESIGATTSGPAVGTIETKSGGGSKFWLDTDNNNPLWMSGASIKATFHF